jgi:hypothetical protein
MKASTTNQRMSMKDRISASAATMMKNLELGFSSLSTVNHNVNAAAVSKSRIASPLQHEPPLPVEAAEGSLEQALRQLFASCTTGASGTVAAEDSNRMEEEEEDNFDTDTVTSQENYNDHNRPQHRQLATASVSAATAPVCLMPSEETTSSSSSASSHHNYPAATISSNRTTRPSRSSPSLLRPKANKNNTKTTRATTAAAVVSLRNLSAMRSSNNNNNSRAIPTASLGTPTAIEHSQRQQQGQQQESTFHGQRRLFVPSSSSSFDTREDNKPTIHRKQQAPPHVQQEPIISSTAMIATTTPTVTTQPFRKAKPPLLQQTYTTPTQTLGQHIYEHLFLEEVQVPADYQLHQLQDNRSQASKHLLPRMGFGLTTATTTPRLFPASSPNPPVVDRDNIISDHSFLMIHAVPSEDEISAISAHTLEAMAKVERPSSLSSVSRDSCKGQQTLWIDKNFRSPPQQEQYRISTGARQQPYPEDSFDDSHNNNIDNNNNSRYSTPQSRSTTEDSSRSFEHWQTSEREYWTSQQQQVVGVGGSKKTKIPPERRRRPPQRRGDATLSTESSTLYDYQSPYYNHHLSSELAEI